MRQALVVDDDLVTTQMLKFWLRRAGYTVTTVRLPSAALAELTATNYDVIFVDLRLPEMDGLELCRQIRALATTPIFVLSASTDQNDRIGAIEAGAAGYLTKPFDPPDLIARVTAAVAKRQVDAEESAG